MKFGAKTRVTRDAPDWRLNPPHQPEAVLYAMTTSENVEIKTGEIRVVSDSENCTVIVRNPSGVCVDIPTLREPGDSVLAYVLDADRPGWGWPSKEELAAYRKAKAERDAKALKQQAEDRKARKASKKLRDLLSGHAEAVDE